MTKLRDAAIARALAVMKAQDRFAKWVAKTFPAGSTVRFVLPRRGGFTGTVSERQFSGADQPTAGLVLEVAQDVAGDLPKYMMGFRERSNLANVEWQYIEEVNP